MSVSPDHKAQRKIRLELLIIVGLAALVFIVAAQVDPVERLLKLLWRLDSWELDELFAVAVFLVFALAVFSLRRWRDAQKASEVLSKRNGELGKALAEVRQLRGILPICSYCKKIRNDSGSWQQIELYVGNHSEVEFSHGLCPDCIPKLYPEDAESVIEHTQAEPTSEPARCAAPEVADA